MNVLFDHQDPFCLAHGGFQIQIEQTRAALIRIGVEVEPLRWWDDKQTGDLIHFWGTAKPPYLRLAKAKGLPVVMTTLFTETCNRSTAKLNRQGWLTRLILSLPAEGIKEQLVWRSFNLCSQNIVGLEAEQDVLETVYRVPPGRISIVPLGLSDTYLKASAQPPPSRGRHLICTGTITPRKRSLEIAIAAKESGVPVLFVGKPYNERDPYWETFKALIDGINVLHHRHVESEQEMVKLLQGSRGLIVNSHFENWCLSAHEAAACGIPVLLPDQKWAHERFGDQASYLNSQHSLADSLRRFHTAAETLPPPMMKHYSWDEVARMLKPIYERTIQSSSQSLR
jgi:glycosyltransferase involved in cell wall biosynthesis